MGCWGVGVLGCVDGRMGCMTPRTHPAGLGDEEPVDAVLGNEEDHAGQVDAIHLQALGWGDGGTGGWRLIQYTCWWVGRVQVG